MRYGATIADRIGSEMKDVDRAVIEHNYGGGQLLAPLVYKDAKMDGDYLKPVKFKGFANTGRPDLGRDIVDPRAFTRSTLNEFLKFGRQLLFMHSSYNQVGEITRADVVEKGTRSMFGIRDGGLLVEGFVDSPVDEELGYIPDHEYAKLIHFVRMQVRRGRLKLMSIGWRPVKTESVRMKDPRTGAEQNFRLIKSLILGEISLVTMAMNPQSAVEVQELQKAFSKMYGADVSDALFSDEMSADEIGNAISEDLPGFTKRDLTHLFKAAYKEAALQIADEQKRAGHDSGAQKMRVISLNEEKKSGFKVVRL